MGGRSRPSTLNDGQEQRRDRRYVYRGTVASEDRSFTPWWVSGVLVPLATATIGLAGGWLLADRQLSAQRQDTDRQLSAQRRETSEQLRAARDGRLADARAGVYNAFREAAEAHLSALFDGNDGRLRDADRMLFSAAGAVELQGTAEAARRTEAVLNRGRQMTHVVVGNGGRRRVRDGDYQAQQSSIRRFVENARREVNR
jgi:hypothetical protein